MAKAKYDWEAIEKDYQLGQLSVRAISDKHGVSHCMILKHAKKYGWVRNLSKQVNDLTKKGLLSKNGNHLVTTPTREDIEAAALTNIQVVTNTVKIFVQEEHWLIFLWNSFRTQLVPAMLSNKTLLQRLNKTKPVYDVLAC